MIGGNLTNCTFQDKNMFDDSSEKSHDHYSPAVREAVSVFAMTYAAWERMSKKDLRDNMLRLDALQGCWDALAKARIAETGTGFYLNAEQYQQAVLSIQSNHKS